MAAHFGSGERVGGLAPDVVVVGAAVPRPHELEGERLALACNTNGYSSTGPYLAYGIR